MRCDRRRRRARAATAADARNTKTHPSSSCWIRCRCIQACSLLKACANAATAGAGAAASWCCAAGCIGRDCPPMLGDEGLHGAAASPNELLLLLAAWCDRLLGMPRLDEQPRGGANGRLCCE